MREVYCQKLRQRAEGLDAPPLPGEIGQRIFDNISKAAWQQWLDKQTMLINEQRLMVFDPAVQQQLREQMLAFLFEDATIDVEGYVPPADNNAG